MDTKKKILVVEDSSFNIVLAESQLSYWGYDYKIVQNAKEALDLLKTEKFDLILLDLMMREMDGFEFLEHMKKKNNKTPIVVISSKTDPDSINRVMGLGAIDYITKPYNSQDLKNKLPEYIKA